MIKGSIDALMRMQEAELKDARYERGALRWSLSWSSFFRHSDRGSSFKLSELQTPDASRSYWVTGIPAWSAA